VVYIFCKHALGCLVDTIPDPEYLNAIRTRHKLLDDMLTSLPTLRKTCAACLNRFIVKVRRRNVVRSLSALSASWAQGVRTYLLEAGSRVRYVLERGHQDNTRATLKIVACSKSVNCGAM
jgi:hypothetical protein